MPVDFETVVLFVVFKEAIRRLENLAGQDVEPFFTDASIVDSLFVFELDKEMRSGIFGVQFRQKAI